jgi:hypothetical protein
MYKDTIATVQVVTTYLSQPRGEEAEGVGEGLCKPRDLAFCTSKRLSGRSRLPSLNNKINSPKQPPASPLLPRCISQAKVNTYSLCRRNTSSNPTPSFHQPDPALSTIAKRNISSSISGQDEPHACPWLPSCQYLPISTYNG